MGLRLLAQDNFTRPNENPLSDGGRWSAYTPLSPTMPEIAANVCQPSAINVDNAAFWNATAFPNDQWGRITIGSLVSGFDNEALILLRASTAADTSYLANAQKAGGGQRYLIVKRIAGVGTTVLLTIAQIPASGDVVLFEAQGTTLTLTVNGIVIGTVVDASIASGTVAIDLFSNHAITDTSITDFQAGDFFAGASTQQGWVNSHRSFVNLR